MVGERLLPDGVRDAGDRNRQDQMEFMQGLVTALKAKARNMRAFSWAALGKGCIRIRQNRAESEVIQETLFGFFLQKGGLKCYGAR